ncbi:MAG: Wzz/FepE/Etk N-terminal domain-containing protein [bacterium]|nr:Wzz/FepE/Etk N-terminal domain-containing protein [bacterium]
MSNPPKTFAEHFTLWMRWRWHLIGTSFCAALLTFLIACFIPKIYRSSAIVMPPSQGGPSLPFLQGMSLDIFGSNDISSAALVTLLQSRSLKDSLITKIDFRSHYKVDDLDKAYEALDGHLEIEIQSQESFGAVDIISIRINVLDKDPQFAALLLNNVLSEWDHLYRDINHRGAKLRREFVENNLWSVSSELASAEDSLRMFQEKYGITSMEPQIMGTVSSGLALQQKATEAKILVQVLDKLFGPDHPDLQRAKLEWQGYEEALKKYQQDSGGPQLTLPTNMAPEIGLIYARHLRRIKTLEIIHQVLVQNYEQSKMQELRDTPALRIVDQGEVPLRKYKPKRALLAFFAAMSTFFMMVILIYFFDYLQRTRDTGESRWVTDSWLQVRSDLTRVKRFFGIRPKT